MAGRVWSMHMKLLLLRLFFLFLNFKASIIFVFNLNSEICRIPLFVQLKFVV